MVPVARLYEDPNNPRTEFPEAALEELTADIRQRGILQPLVVHPADDKGCHRIHFGARRLRAAVRAGLVVVPVVVRDAPVDPYTQVAENQKRHGLTPLDLARFIRSRVDAGESNADIGRRLGMNLTTLAHHLTLLDLPPDLDQAMKSGRCTSPRTLHELSKLHGERPEQVRQLLAGDAEITRSAVSALRSSRKQSSPTDRHASNLDKLIVQANAACNRLERMIDRITLSDTNAIGSPQLDALRTRVDGVTARWLQGSDRQTPSQTKR